MAEPYTPSEATLRAREVARIEEDWEEWDEADRWLAVPRWHAALPAALVALMTPIIECRARHPEDSSVRCHYVTGHLSRNHVGFRMVNGVPLQIWRWC